MKLILSTFFVGALLAISGCYDGTATNTQGVAIVQQTSLPATGYTNTNYLVKYVIQNTGTTTWPAAEVSVTPTVPLPIGFVLATNTCNTDIPPQGTCTWEGTFNNALASIYQLTLEFNYPGGQKVLTPVNAEAGTPQTTTLITVPVHVAVGDAGNTSDTILYSTDSGNSWQAADSINLAGASPTNLQDVTWNGTVYVAIGDGGAILTSSDAKNWVRVNSGTTADLKDIAWNGSELVAVGANSTILVSTDKEATLWAPATVPSPVGDTPYDLAGITWNSSLREFVVVGNGNSDVALTSPNGNDWGLVYNQSLGVSTVYAVASADTTLIETTSNGKVFTSTDGGDTWNPPTSFTDGLGDNQVYGAAWNGNIYVSVLAYGVIVDSLDATNWAAVKYYPYDPYTSYYHFYDVTWDGSKFMAVGTYQIAYPTYSNTGTIITSNDGIHWTTVTNLPGVNVKLNGII